MSSQTVCNPYAKLKLSTQDLPDNDETLREGIAQLIAVLLEQDDITIPGMHLPHGEALVLECIVSSKDEILGTRRKFVGSEEVFLCKLRKKLKREDIRLPRQGGVIYERDREQLQKLVPKDRRCQATINSLRSILKFSPFSFDMDSLPDTVAELQDITLQVIALLRGQPESITLSGLTTAEKIVLSSLLAKQGPISWDRLYEALYLPFNRNPAFRNCLSVFVSNIRKALKPYGIIIKGNTRRSLEMDDANRKTLFTCMSSTPANITPPPPPPARDRRASLSGTHSP